MLTKSVGIQFLVQNKQLHIFSFGIDNKHTPHGVDVYPQSAGGVPFTAAYIACKGDPVANLQEDLAAEQKARATYEKLIDLCADDPDVIDPLRFLREREVVHFQRFGEALNRVQEKLAEKKFYMNDDMNCMMNNNLRQVLYEINKVRRIVFSVPNFIYFCIHVFPLSLL